jgi:hypothetical protein
LSNSIVPLEEEIKDDRLMKFGIWISMVLFLELEKVLE